MRVRPLLGSLAASMVLVLALVPATLGAPNHRTVQILDNCGPSFNDVLGPGACIREGGMSFDTFIKLLMKGGAQSWRFAPEQLKLAEGGTITAVNKGGEFHTFTEVAQFGGGCVPELNEALGLTPVPECLDPAVFATVVPPGVSRTTEPLASGTHRFQCVIHPWQRTTAEVR